MESRHVIFYSVSSDREEEERVSSSYCHILPTRAALWNLLQTGEQWEGASPGRTRKNFKRLQIQHHFCRSRYTAQEGPVGSSDTKPLNIIFPQCNWSNETPRVRWVCAALAWKYQSCCCCLEAVPGLKGVKRVSQQRCRAWGQVCSRRTEPKAQQR